MRTQSTMPPLLLVCVFARCSHRHTTVRHWLYIIYRNVRANGFHFGVPLAATNTHTKYFTFCFSPGDCFRISSYERLIPSQRFLFSMLFSVFLNSQGAIVLTYFPIGHILCPTLTLPFLYSLCKFGFFGGCLFRA